MKKNLLIIPLLFLTVIVFGTNLSAQGETCDTPLVVASLPFNDAGNTSAYGDNYETTDVPPIAANAVTDGTGSTSYLTGDDVVYAYTPVTNEIITISTTNDDDWIGLWAFTGCPFASAVGYHTAMDGSTRIIQDLPVIGGVTYYFVISSWGSLHQSTAYTIEITALAACSGAPTAGTFPATEAVCAGYPVVLEATGSTSGMSGLAGQWQERAAGSADPWVDIAGATTNPYTIPSAPTTAMEYQYVLSCGVDQDVSNTMTTTLNASTDCYCEPIPTYGCANGARINGVSTSGGSTSISNTATGCSGGYIDYSATHGAEVEAGTFFVITVDVTNYSGGVKVWIDYNQDGIFDASELVAESAAIISSGNSYTESILVPAGAMSGETRMRVRLVEGSTAFDACSTQSYGETEDYKFEITAAPSCLPPSDLNTGATSSTSADLTWTENGSATEWQVEYGAPGFTQGTGTLETTTSNPHTITITPDTQYDFYVRSVCGVGDSSYWAS